MRLGGGNGDPAEVGVRDADEGAELDLDVEFACGCEGGRGGSVWGREVAVGADDGCAGDEDRGRAAGEGAGWGEPGGSG